MSVPYTAENSTASQMTTIASVAHSSGTRSSTDQLGFSVRTGSCETVDTSHLLSGSTLAHRRAWHIRAHTDSACSFLRSDAGYDGTVERPLIYFNHEDEGEDLGFITYASAAEPAAPFRLLRELIVTRYPSYPPYQGIHDDVIPHLTVAVGDTTV